MTGLLGSALAGRDLESALGDEVEWAKRPAAS